MVLISKILMIPINLSFQFRRLQFPVNLCILMAINKAQGQALNLDGSNRSMFFSCSIVRGFVTVS